MNKLDFSQSAFSKFDSNEPDFWQNFWNGKAQENTDFQATGRSTMHVPDFLYTVYEIIRILKLKKEDRLLDIGCGTGLIALALSPWLDHIHGIDISSKMIERASFNTRETQNVTLSIGSLIETEQEKSSFHKILAYSVLQYLPDQSALEHAFDEINRVLRKNGHALFAANPDPDKKYHLIEAIEAKSDIKMKETEKNLLDRTAWFSKETLVQIANKKGFRAEILPIHPRIQQHSYMFDLLLEKICD